MAIAQSGQPDRGSALCALLEVLERNRRWVLGRGFLGVTSPHFLHGIDIKNQGEFLSHAAF